MNTPPLSLSTSSDASVIKDRLSSLMNFLCHVLIFLGGFVTVASIVLYIVYELSAISKLHSCPVNNSYPLDHGQFLHNFTFKRPGFDP